MGKLSIYNFISLDGYFKGLNEDISWHKHGSGEEESKFAAESMQSGNTLIFGRVTYEMMASFWPTEAAMNFEPDVAKGMNNAKKLVFSTTMDKADWENTTLVNGNLEAEIKKRKAAGENMTVLGSGTIITQLADAGLIDEYSIMLDPVALGEGTSIFKGIKQQLNLKTVATRIFDSGVILMTFVPAEA